MRNKVLSARVRRVSSLYHLPRVLMRLQPAAQRER